MSKFVKGGRRPHYNPNEDPYLKRYPQARLEESSTPGYGYDFGNFKVLKILQELVDGFLQ